MTKKEWAMRRAALSQRGFSTVELTIVALLVVVLIAILLPRFDMLSSKIRITDVRMDATYIGAAIETLIIEGRYDPGDDMLYDLIYEKSGRVFDGEVSELSDEGCFIYTKTVEGVPYSVFYDARDRVVREESSEIEKIRGK